jgi:hypothetical protein
MVAPVRGWAADAAAGLRTFGEGSGLGGAWILVLGSIFRRSLAEEDLIQGDEPHRGIDWLRGIASPRPVWKCSWRLYLVR